MNTLSIAGLIAIGLAGAGCGGPSASDLKDTHTAFVTLCSGCHGPTGKPPEAMVARLAVRDLTAPEFRAKVTPELVEHQIRAGSQNKLMPSFQGVIDDVKIMELAAYVASPRFLEPP